MEKINFQDNITKANAETMNQFQDNIENAINEVNNKTISNTLYENESGATGNITLTESVSNYSVLEIVYGCDGYYFYTKIYSPNNKDISLMANYNADSIPGRIYLYTSNYTINGSTVTFNSANNKCLTEQNTIATYGTNSYVRIYKVIGYK